MSYCTLKKAATDCLQTCLVVEVLDALECHARELVQLVVSLQVIRHLPSDSYDRLDELSKLLHTGECSESGMAQPLAFCASASSTASSFSRSMYSLACGSRACTEGNLKGCPASTKQLAQPEST